MAQGKQAVREAPQMNMFGASQQMNYTGAAYQSYGGGMGMGMGMYQDGAFQQQAQHPPQMSMSMEQNVQLADVDFDAAFQEAVAHAQEMDQLRGVTDNSGLENAATADLQQDQQPLSEGIRIGSDAIQYKEQADRTADQDAQDADELARTAGQLLHSVQHDTSTKFQNSQFLDLMRKLRDREVEVANNDLQFVSTSTNLNGEETTTSNQLFSATEHHQQNQEQSAHNDQEQLDAGHFEFPDMDSVYRPDGPTKQTFDSTITPFLHAPPYTTYGFEDDQFPQQTARQPQRQTDELHPGGRWYPDQSPVMSTAQSATAAPENGDGGSLENRMSTSEFEYTDESGNLARRFVR